MYGNRYDVFLSESQIETPNWFLRPVLARAKWLHICDFAFVLLRHNFNVHFKFFVLQIRWRDDWRKTNDNKTSISFLMITSWSRFHFQFLGSFPLCQRFRKFRSEFKWKGPFQFLPTGIFGITSGGGLFISVGIFRSIFNKPVLCPN